VNTTDWVILAVVIGVLVVAAVGVLAYWGSRRRRVLRERFGPEYDRMVGEAGSRRKAERELRGREQQYETLDIRPLPEGSRAR
jgi:hypothetical protein